MPQDMTHQDGSRYPQVGSQHFDAQSELRIAEKAEYFALFSPLWAEKPHKVCYYILCIQICMHQQGTMNRYMLGTKRTSLMVDPRVHILVKLYAKERGITVTEATYILLGKALSQEYGLEFEEAFKRK